jgi:large subunit ribosomal protein L31
MKPGIHPEYRPVVFRDRAGGLAFLTRSTATSDTTVEWEDGRTYPVIDVDISSASHPFWTGRGRVVDTEGRVAAFRRRYQRGGTEGSTGGQGAR